MTIYHPEEEDYKIYYAQALYQACLYEEAMKVTVQIENPEMNGKVIEMPKTLFAFITWLIILRTLCKNNIIIKNNTDDLSHNRKILRKKEINTQYSI